MGLLNNDGKPPGGGQESPDTGPPPEWINSLPEDMRSEESITSLRKFKPAEGEELVPMPLSVVKSYRELESKVGANHVIIPGDDAGDDAWGKVYNALGRPDTADAYGFAPPQWPDGLTYDENITKAYGTKAHELGLSKKQAQGIFDWWNSTTLENFTTAMARTDEFARNTEAELRKEWGTKYDAHMKKCRMVANSIGGKDFMQFLSVTGLENDPRIIRFMHNIASRVSEATLIDGHNDDQGNKIPTKEELETMMKDPRYGLYDRSQFDQAYYDKVYKLWEARVAADQPAA